MMNLCGAVQDPFILDDSFRAGFRDVNGKTLRSSVINPAEKTLILITAGQSQWTTLTPTSFTPTNPSKVDNFNVYDGANYNCSGPLLGAEYIPANGDGNVSARVADQFVSSGIFDRVIVVPIALGGTEIAQWDTGILSGRIPVALRRLASRGIVPASTGVTFALLWGQGESDGLIGTTQSAWENAFQNIVTTVLAAGFAGRIFVAKETWSAGVVSSTIQAAQVAVVDSVTVFSGGDLDALDASYRQSGNTHFNDAGAAAAASLVYNAMRASGAPY